MPQKPMRLPPVKVLRVRNPNGKVEQPCMQVMTSVLGKSTYHVSSLILLPGIFSCLNGLSLPWFPDEQPPFDDYAVIIVPCCATCTDTRSPTACWASAGYNTSGCAALENALRGCMDQPKKPKEPSSTVNYHLGRMYDKMIPHSKGK